MKNQYLYNDVGLLTGMLVPIAIMTSPIVYESMFKIHPARLTDVTNAKLSTAIHTTDMQKLTKNHFL